MVKINSIINIFCIKDSTCGHDTLILILFI